MNDFRLSDEKICFGELEIFLHRDNNQDHFMRRDDVLYMFKNAGYVGTYERIKRDFDGKAIKNILEIGIFRGGGAAFLHRLFGAQRIVCADLLAGPIAPLERYRQQNEGAVAIYYGVDQADRSAMTAIMEDEFAEGIDLVVDDACHFYEETKAAFETVFPHLRPGGIYVIEDWDWAHSPMAQLPSYPLADKLALTNLIFELVMLHAAGSVIDYMAFGPGMMWVRRGAQPLPPGEFALDDTPKRARELGRI